MMIYVVPLATLTVDIHEPKWFADQLGVEERVHVGYCDVLIEHGGETWGIERKTWTDALNSWMSKRLEKQLSELVGLVDHAVLLIQHEPERRIRGGQANTYERFKKHTPNLKRHLNRLCSEVCPVIYADDSASAVKEILRMKTRIEGGDFGKMTVYDRRISHVDPVIQFLMSVPRIGKTRATFIKSRFSSLNDLLEKSDELGDMFRNETDVESIKSFLHGDWTCDEND